MRKTVPIDWHYKVHGHRVAGWVILAYSGNTWHDVEEGPFDDFEAARDFAESEVGVPWVVVPIAKEYSALQGPPSDPRVLRQARTRTEDPGGPGSGDMPWGTRARAALVGRRIVAASYLSDADARAMFWSERGVLLQLDDGTLLYPMRDDEGNGPGALGVNPADGEEWTLPVLLPSRGRIADPVNPYTPRSPKRRRR